MDSWAASRGSHDLGGTDWPTDGYLLLLGAVYCWTVAFGSERARLLGTIHLRLDRCYYSHRPSVLGRIEALLGKVLAHLETSYPARPRKRWRDTAGLKQPET